MNKLFIAICAALALNAEATTEESLVSSITVLKQKSDSINAVAKSLGLADGVGEEEITAACVALKATAKPDPAKYVPIATVTDMQTQIAALTAKQNAREIEDLVAPALAEGKLLPTQEAWARDLGASNVTALKTYLASAPAIAALSGTQTQGEPLIGANEHGLTQAEIAVCKSMSLSPEEFAKTKKAQAA